MATFYIEQFGCRATQADGAAIERQLLDRGCTRADAAHTADVVVLNTCTVTAAADAHTREAIRNSPALGNPPKPENPNLPVPVPARQTADFLPLDVLSGSAPILIGNIFDQQDVLVAPVLGGEGNQSPPPLKFKEGC